MHRGCRPHSRQNKCPQAQARGAKARIALQTVQGPQAIRRFVKQLHTSVPAEDLDHLSGSTTEPLTRALAAQHADTQLLSVMIHDEVTPEILGLMPNLQFLITRSDGYDHLPLAWCKAQGIHVHHLEGYATESVAEMALAMLLSIRRRLPEAQAHMTRTWDRRALIGQPLRTCTIGILGTGRIGSRLAKMLLALGHTVVAHDIAPSASLEAHERFTYLPWDAFWRTADTVSIHVPLNPTTRHLVDADALAQMPPGACLVNTSRGAVVDEEAVLAALDGRLGGFAADVLAGEPDPPNRKRFAQHENVLLSPHIAAFDTATIAARYSWTADIINDIQAGTPAPYRIV